MKQTSEAQDVAMQNHCREMLNVLAPCLNQNGRQVLEGTERVAGKNKSAIILRHRKLEQHKNNYLA